MTTHVLELGWGRGQSSGPSWLRTALITVAGCLVLGGGLVMRAARIDTEATNVQAAAAVSNAPVTAYGAKDPYGFGPCAIAEAGAPGGVANQEDLAIAERPAPRDTAAPISRN